MSGTAALFGLLGLGAGMGLVALGFALWAPTAPARVRTRVRARLSPNGPAVRRAALAAGLGAVVGYGTGWPLAGLAAAVGAARGLRAVRARRGPDRVAVVEAVATWAQMLRDTLTAAAGLHQAITATAPLAPAPLAVPLGRLTGRLERGARLDAALRRLAAEVADPTVDLVIAALVVASTYPARRLGPLLADLATTARDEVDLHRRVEASRARVRTSRTVVIATTVSFAVLVALTDRAFLAPYGTVTGQVVLTGVLGIFMLGLAWLDRMAQPAPMPRSLAPVAPATARRESTRQVLGEAGLAVPPGRPL